MWGKKSTLQGRRKTYANTLCVWKIIQVWQEVKFYGEVERKEEMQAGKEQIFFFFFLRLITLQYCIGFAIHCHETATGVHVFPILNPPPTSFSIPSLWVGPEHLALKLDWQFISHRIIYMLQGHSPKPSHPRPLPQSPKDCSIHLCFFCCLAYRVIITIFLNSICMR